MSTQNPQADPPHRPARNSTVQPDAPDFIETPELVMTPASDHQPIPPWLYIICAISLFLAGSSFAGLSGPGYYDQGPGAPVVASSAAGGLASAPTDPMDIGKAVYAQNCANCHQGSGAGQPGSYPPLGGSEYVNGDPGTLVLIMLHGLQGPVTVEGGDYGSQQMPGWSTNLTDEKIAAVMTYIRGSWGNKSAPVKPEDVSGARAKSASQSDAYTVPTLMKASPRK